MTIHDPERRLADRQSNILTGYEPNDLIEMINTEVTPIFFHKLCVTSTCDSAESIATHPPESDLDDEQIKGYAGFTTVPTGEISKCRTTTSSTHLQRKLCQAHHVSE